MAFAGLLAVGGLSAAVAQAPGQSSPFPPPPGQTNASPFPPPPGQTAPAGTVRSGAPPAQASPFPPPGSAGGRHACEAFPPLRADAEKAAGVIQQAGERKATREEVCPLFQRFAAVEAKMVKFLVDHQQQCGVPPEAVKQAKANHAKTLKIRTQVCSAAPAGAGPTLSDALGGPILPEPDTTKKPGRGIFDTLTGSPLAR